MAIKKLQDNMNIISELSDEPNDVEGLSSAELKAKFDTAGTIIKAYVNNSLIPDVETEIVKKVNDSMVQSGNMPGFGKKGQALIKASDEHFDWEYKMIAEVPPGGLSEYVLVKASNNDFDVQFKHPYAFEWALEATFEKAGTYTWTAPDAYGDGKPYSVGAYIIGGGGSGGAAAVYHTTTDIALTMATGGASGYARCAVIQVTPGGKYPIAVGAGGAAFTHNSVARTNIKVSGNAGGASTFAGISALGGGAGTGAITVAYSGNFIAFAAPAANGGQGSDAIDVELNEANRTMRPIAPAKGQCTYNCPGDYALAGGLSDLQSFFNRFTGEYYLAAGGGALLHCNSSIYKYYTQKGYTFDDGRKSGDAVSNTAYTITTPIKGQNANAPGCGGGGAITRTNVSATSAISGAGADGAVYIYIRRLGR